MGIEMIALWALVGWCGTPPGPRPWPWPDPDPNPWISKVVGVVGGIAGGWAFNATLVSGVVIVDGMGAINAAATAVGAYVGSVFISDMYGLIRGRKG